MAGRFVFKGSPMFFFRLQDASAGDYASAIETLVTAISLIKQSKVAQDDRLVNGER